MVVTNATLWVMVVCVITRVKKPREESNTADETTVRISLAILANHSGDSFRFRDDTHEVLVPENVVILVVEFHSQTTVLRKNYSVADFNIHCDALAFLG